MWLDREREGRAAEDGLEKEAGAPLHESCQLGEGFESLGYVLQ